MEPLVGSFLCGQPLKFDQGYRGSKALLGSRVFEVEVNLAEFSEARSLTDRDTRRDRFEIAVVGQQYCVAVLSSLGDNWIGCVGRQNVSQAGDLVPPAFKQFTGRLRDIVVRKKTAALAARSGGFSHVLADRSDVEFCQRGIFTQNSLVGIFGADETLHRSHRNPRPRHNKRIVGDEFMPLGCPDLVPVPIAQFVGFLGNLASDA